MRRLRAWLLIGLAAVVVLIVVALVAIPRVVDTPRIQALIATTVSQNLGRPVKFSDVSIRILPLPSVVLKDLEVAEDPAFGQGPFLRLKEAIVRLRLRSLLLLRVELGDFILTHPMISLVQAPDGRWNFTMLGAHAEPRPTGRARGGGGAAGGAGTAGVLGGRIKIEDGVVTYEPRAGGATARYRVEELGLTMSGSALSTLTFTGGAKVKPGDVTVKIEDGNLVANGARALADAPVRAKITVDGKEIRDLVALAMGPAPIIAGGVKGTLAVSGTLAHARATGEVELPNLVMTQTQPSCPEPKKRSLALGTVKVNATWEPPRFLGRPVTATLVGGTVTTNLTATLDQGVRVDLADLTVKGAAIEKVLVDFLCQGYAATGLTDVTGTLGLRPTDLWRTLNGQGRVQIGAGRVVGTQALALLGNLTRVGGALSSIIRGEIPNLGAAPVEYDGVTATYTITNGVVSTRDFLLSSRVLKIAAAGTYTLGTGAMNLDVGVTNGRTELRAKVAGTASSPSIRVSPSAALRDVDPARVEKDLQELLKKFR